MSLLEKHLIELDFGFLATLFFFVKNVSVLAVLEIAQFFRNNLGFLGLF